MDSNYSQAIFYYNKKFFACGVDGFKKALRRLKSGNFYMIKNSHDADVYYSKTQLDLICTVLLDAQVVGGGRRRKNSMSLRELTEEIDQYSNITELDDELIDENFGENDHLESVSEEKYQKAIKNAAERIRRFIKRESTPELPFIQSILGYLMHPEIRALSQEALNKPDVDYSAAKNFGEFVWQRQPDSGEESKCLEGKFITRQKIDGRVTLRYLDLSSSGHPFFSFINEICIDEATQLQNELRCGWAVFSPNSEIFVFERQQDDLRIQNLSGVVSRDAHQVGGVQILFEGTPFSNLPTSIVGLAQSHANDDFSASSGKHNDFVHSWAISEKNNVIFFKRITEFPSLNTHRSVKINSTKKKPQLGSFRFSRGKFNQDEKEFMNDTTKDDFNERNNSLPPLIRALKSCDVEEFRNLVEDGEDVNCRHPQTGLTPLHYVAMLSRMDEYEVLKNQETLDVLVRDSSGRLPSIHAMYASNYDLAKELRELERAEGAKRGIVPTAMGDVPFSEGPSDG